MSFIKKNKLAVIAALFVGLIYIVPNIAFIASLGGNYKGIPMMQTANEDFYLGRIQEIIDGHPLVGSFVFFEYKNQMPLSPPGGEFIYAIPSLIFGISPVNTLIASRFFLPFILFLLVYFLIRQLTAKGGSTSIGRLNLQNINAVAGALFTTLGYDLIDYRTIFKYFKGMGGPGDFLIWSRPVNPILGAIFLMSFFIFIWLIIERSEERKKKFYIAGASAFLALMIMNYFFSWGIAISVVGILILIYLLKKEYGAVKNLIFVILFGFLLSAPYWYISMRASWSTWYGDSVLRAGLFYTHYPLLNKLMLAVLLFYLILVFVPVLNKSKGEKWKIVLGNWHWFCLVLIAGSLWVYMQQIITGIAVWPYHFVQYTIPLAIIVFMVLFYNIVREKLPFLWKAGIFAVILSSLSFGIYTQASAYRQSYRYYANLQSYALLFNWINQQEKDCVILAEDEPENGKTLNGFILAFTHCNVYDSSWFYSLMNNERQQHNYFVRMFLNGATAQNVGKYLEEHKQEARGFLFSNWKEYHGTRDDFPDVPDNFEEKIKNLPEEYGKFVAGDLKSELQKYKLDYILISGQAEGLVPDLLKGLKFVYRLNDISIYQFK